MAPRSHWTTANGRPPVSTEKRPSAAQGTEYPSTPQCGLNRLSLGSEAPQAWQYERSFGVNCFPTVVSASPEKIHRLHCASLGMTLPKRKCLILYPGVRRWQTKPIRSQSRPGLSSESQSWRAVPGEFRRDAGCTRRVSFSGTRGTMSHVPCRIPQVHSMFA